jgi:hypothetical protein
MINVHEFNSLWWGNPVGISIEVEDLFLSQEQLLSDETLFDWIEFRVPFGTLPNQKLGPDNGAHLVETQLTYQKNISRLGSCPEGVELVTTTEQIIDFSDFSAFSHERYSKLRLVDSEKLARRYSLLAGRLVEEAPRTCATVFYKSLLVGYVFGRVKEGTAVFDLAVTSKQSQVSGQILYEAAGHLFNQAGAKRMTSSFNAANIGALNAHVRMQCRFIEATSIWLIECNIPRSGE